MVLYLVYLLATSDVLSRRSRHKSPHDIGMQSMYLCFHGRSLVGIRECRVVQTQFGEEPMATSNVEKVSYVGQSGLKMLLQRHVARRVVSLLSWKRQYVDGGVLDSDIGVGGGDDERLKETLVDGSDRISPAQVGFPASSTA
jgi:hypothetical protein